MIIYESTIRELWELFQKPGNVVPNLIETNLRKKAGQVPSSGEWKSWATTLNDFIQYMNSDEKMKNLSVLLEYNVPWSRGRIDVIIAGKKNNDKHLFTIELKGWSKAAVNQKTKTIDAYTTYSVSHPSQQIKAYKKDLTDLTNLKYGQSYNIDTLVALPNYDEDGKYRLWDKIFEYENQDVHTFDSRNISKIIELISSKISEALDENDLYMLDNVKRKPINPLMSLESMDQITLSSSQEMVLRKIVDISRNEKQKVVIVKGAPGCGKTILGINLVIELAALGMNCDLIAPGEEFRSSLKKKWANVNWVNNIWGIDISEKFFSSKQADVIVFDEGHKFSKLGMAVPWFINTTLKHANILVAFVDDYQIVRKDGAQSKHYISHCIENDIKYEILELTESFRNGGDISYPDWVRSWLYNETISSGDMTYRQLHFMNNNFQVNVHDTEEEFINSYETDYDNEHTRLMTMWFKHPNFIMNLDQYGMPKKEIEIGGKFFSWNINNQWLAKYKKAYGISNVPKALTEMARISFNELKGKDKYSIGYYHNVQGAEFDNAYVYIPKFIKWDDFSDEIVFDVEWFFTNPDSKNMINGNGFWPKTKDRQNYLEMNIELLKNRLYILLTRGTKKVNIFCEDKKLRDRLVEINIKKLKN